MIGDRAFGAANDSSVRHRPASKSHSPAPAIERLLAQLLADVFDLKRVIHRVMGHVAIEDAEDFLGDRGGHVPEGFFGLCRAMGGEQYIAAADQGVAGRGRLDGEDVAP